MSNFTIWLFLLIKREENTQNRIVKLKWFSDRPTVPPQNECCLKLMRLIFLSLCLQTANINSGVQGGRRKNLA